MPQTRVICVSGTEDGNLDRVTQRALRNFEWSRRDPGTRLRRTLPYAQTHGTSGSSFGVLLGVASVLQPLAVFLSGVFRGRLKHVVAAARLKKLHSAAVLLALLL